ncbi:TonB-dependent receptor plug domain-containing protein [Maribacter chungangensis]|uniref:TonB-dependent receptor plug domain-containing protein n=1 Tax=Maribacter chungangensis TaxID=1069117 RepID=A0ABW3B5R0_9FLAO
MRFFIAFLILVLSSGQMTAQKEKQRIQWVNGTVLNAEQQPVKRAIIYLDSVKTKIKTNKKGQFKIGLKASNKTISAYAWNYGIVTEVYQGDNGMLLVFPESESVVSEEELQELGFETKVKRAKKEPKDYSQYLTMYQLIATEIPGARVNGTTIQLVPVNSVQAGQDPLIIVDGTPVSSLEFIFPREVASVRVLRDDAASFYGSRGANGVLLIRMKN